MQFRVKYHSKTVEVIIRPGVSKDYLFPPAKYLLLTDTNVGPLYQETFIKRIPDLQIVTIPAGEKSKNLNNAVEIIRHLSKEEFSRTDYLLTLGGGVIGDLGAFVASVYKRGMRLIHIPTSLLSQVDSCLGGKTGIDFIGENGLYKNQIGTIYHPELVLVDPDFLKTLPAEERSSAFGEIIKTALCCNREVFDLLFTDFSLPDLIGRVLKIKAEITEADEFEKRERLLLNFGHTFGHAIESLSGIRHGEAVALGMLHEIHDEGIKNSLLELYKKFNLPTMHPYQLEELKNLIRQDKKITTSKIRLPAVLDVGKTTILETDLETYLGRIK
ncbi:MAG: 3-dehydroquinate synthase [Acholeplasmataceae bacterium]|jgi:3-dehydroquinate synthase|nr:3-dehydroquinate synthase [Acholeplasmataceae bacterium]